MSVIEFQVSASVHTHTHNHIHTQTQASLQKKRKAPTVGETYLLAKLNSAKNYLKVIRFKGIPREKSEDAHVYACV